MKLIQVKQHKPSNDECPCIENELNVRQFRKRNRTNSLKSRPTTPKSFKFETSGGQSCANSILKDNSDPKCFMVSNLQTSNQNPLVPIHFPDPLFGSNSKHADEKKESRQIDSIQIPMELDFRKSINLTPVFEIQNAIKAENFAKKDTFEESYEKYRQKLAISYGKRWMDVFEPKSIEVSMILFDAIEKSNNMPDRKALEIVDYILSLLDENQTDGEILNTLTFLVSDESKYTTYYSYEKYKVLVKSSILNNGSITKEIQVLPDQDYNEVSNAICSLGFVTSQEQSKSNSANHDNDDPLDAYDTDDNYDTHDTHDSDDTHDTHDDYHSGRSSRSSFVFIPDEFIDEIPDIGQIYDVVDEIAQDAYYWNELESSNNSDPLVEEIIGTTQRLRFSDEWTDRQVLCTFIF